MEHLLSYHKNNLSPQNVLIWGCSLIAKNLEKRIVFVPEQKNVPQIYYGVLSSLLFTFQQKYLCFVLSNTQTHLKKLRKGTLSQTAHISFTFSLGKIRLKIKKKNKARRYISICKRFYSKTAKQLYYKDRVFEWHNQWYCLRQAAIRLHQHITAALQSYQEVMTHQMIILSFFFSLLNSKTGRYI